MNKDSGTISFIAGLLFGAIIGVTMGMLLTPEEGSEARKKLKVAGDRFLKKSLNVIDQFQETQVEPFIEKMAEKATGMQQEAPAKHVAPRVTIKPLIKKKAA